MRAIQILLVSLNCLGFSAYMVKFVLKYCVQKKLPNLKDSKLTQSLYGNKTGFVRLGHIFSYHDIGITMKHYNETND